MDHESCVAGWLCCSFVDPQIPAQDGLASLDWTFAAFHMEVDAEQCLMRSSGRPTDVFKRNRGQGISKATSDASLEALSKFPDVLRHAKCLVVNTMVTDPVFQRRWVRSGLLYRAMKRANREKVAISAQVWRKSTAWYLIWMCCTTMVLPKSLNTDHLESSRTKVFGKEVWGPVKLIDQPSRCNILQR